jgi:hypothetical protein
MPGGGKMMSASDTRKECVLLLSCIGNGLKYFLQMSEDFNQRYLAHAHFYHHVSWLKKTDEFEYSDGVTEIWPCVVPQLRRCVAYVYHDPEWLPNKSFHEVSALIDDVIPSGVPRLSIPLPYFHPFWPFQCNEPRVNDPDIPLNRYRVRPQYHYGDNYVLRLLAEGVLRDEVISRYLALDIAAEVDLNALLRRTLAAIEKNESSGLVRVADFIGSTFRTHKLFQTINHPSNRLLLYMANQVLNVLGCRQVPDAALVGLTELIDEPMPVHPSLARFFGATYINEETRYPLDGMRNLTFAEYLRDYVFLEEGLISIDRDAAPPIKYAL